MKSRSCWRPSTQPSAGIAIHACPLALWCRKTSSSSAWTRSWNIAPAKSTTLIIPENGNFKGRDISHSRSLVAKVAAEKADLKHRISGLYTAVQGINLVSHLWKSESTLASLSPAVVVLHVSSNDLANFWETDELEARNIAMLVIGFACHVMTHYGVKAVVLNFMLPRDSSNMQCSAETFLYNMNVFNNTLKTQCSQIHGLQYNHLLGFYHIKNLKKRDSPLPISKWSKDGIHCNQDYQRKYIQCLRFAIMQASVGLNWVSCEFFVF